MEIHPTVRFLTISVRLLLCIVCSISDLPTRIYAFCETTLHTPYDAKLARQSRNGTNRFVRRMYAS